ncbi:MAG: PD-(D/E)XK nuclease family protein, partial [Deltaproteobacteria bacterium]|nr:PD-(D/E)XK nuclease family protein [Deltaproteobacteria bacterium]
EHWLGSPSVPCPTPAGTLHLRGKIDLLWQDPKGGLLVHDIKSGKAAHFDVFDGFELNRDLQVLTYAACLMAEDRDVSEVGLIFPAAGSKAEARCHRDQGLAQGLDWCRKMLATAHKLLSARAFAPLPASENLCTRCPFAPTCEQDWRQQALAQVEKAAAQTTKLPEELAALVALLRARTGEVTP